MVFDNSKRMALVQDMLKEEKKNKKVDKMKRSNRGLSSASGHSKASMSSRGLRCSAHSRTGTVTSSASSYASSGSEDYNIDPLHCRKIMKLQKSWESIKQKVKTDIMGEQIVMHMMSVDPRARQAMRLESIRSPRFDEIAIAVMETIESLVFFLGPDFDQDDVMEFIERLTDQGISPDTLAKALPEALNECLQQAEDGGLSDKEKNIWKETMGAVLVHDSPTSQ